MMTNIQIEEDFIDTEWPAKPPEFTKEDSMVRPNPPLGPFDDDHPYYPTE